MQKRILLGLFALLLLSGCSKEASEKLCRVEFISAEDDTVLATLENQDSGEISAMLGLDTWPDSEEAEDVGRELTPEYKVLVWQEKTNTVADQLNHRDPGYEKIIEYTTFRDSPYARVAFSSDNLIVSVGSYFIIPEEIRENIRKHIR